MEYIVEGRKFSLSYKELREKYIEFTEMDDKEFLSNLPSAAHLACIICYLKEIPAYNCIGDLGIIHELVHLMDEGTVTDISEIRALFKSQLELS